MKSKDNGRSGENRRRAFQGSAHAPFHKELENNSSLRSKLFSAPFQSLPQKSIPIQPLFSFSKIPSESRKILENFDEIINSVRPLNAKQKQSLPIDIKNLSHNLTDSRKSRRIGYMNAHQEISAYVNYFLWWNLVRLVPLFSGLEENAFCLKDGDAVLDLGSGPLTVAISLWLARPELRSKKIKFYCCDLSQNALSVGEEIFLKICAETLASSGSDAEPWQIIRIKSDLTESLKIKEKAALITSANVFNEMIQDESKTLEFYAKKNGEFLLSFAAENSKILVIEPGVPRSARFISLLRDSFLRKNLSILAPCTHCEKCPMAGRTQMGRAFNLNEKWCNFAFSTESAPKKLLKLSEKSQLPKERAVLSFILMEKNALDIETGKNLSGEKTFEKSEKIKLSEKSFSASKKSAANNSRKIKIRVNSDAIRLPWAKSDGYYCCSEKGMLLLIPGAIENKIFNGSMLEINDFDEKKCTSDKKTGALIVRI